MWSKSINQSLGLLDLLVSIVSQIVTEHIGENTTDENDKRASEQDTTNLAIVVLNSHVEFGKTSLNFL